MTEPSIISAPTPSGRHAVSLKFVPDMRTLAVKERIKKEIKERLAGVVDMNSTVKY